MVSSLLLIHKNYLGRELKIFIVDKSNAKITSSISARLARIGSKPVRELAIKRRSGVSSIISSRSHLANKSRPLAKLSAEDLDHELDDYMKAIDRRIIVN